MVLMCDCVIYMNSSFYMFISFSSVSMIDIFDSVLSLGIVLMR